MHRLSSCCKLRAKINWPICCPYMRVCGGMRQRRCIGLTWYWARPADCSAFRSAVQLLQVAGKNQLAYMLPLYAGLRRNEAKTLHWFDLVLGETGGLLRLPICCPVVASCGQKSTGLYAAPICGSAAE